MHAVESHCREVTVSALLWDEKKNHSLVEFFFSKRTCELTNCLSHSYIFRVVRKYGLIAYKMDHTNQELVAATLLHSTLCY